MRPQGQREGSYDSDRFQTRTLRYSLRRVSPLDSVNRRPHNPKVGGSNPPPATNLKYLILRVFPSRHSPSVKNLYKRFACLGASRLSRRAICANSKPMLDCAKLAEGISEQHG